MPIFSTSKTMALAIALLLTIIAPASAIIGFCARMPCCGHSSSDSLSFATERADCCTTLTCYESPSAKLATTVSAPLSLLTAPLLVLGDPAVPPPDPTNTRAPIDTSPPPALRNRLAVLATLLI
jgi:hypothetical protein